MGMIRFWIFRQWVKILCRSKGVQYIYFEAWHDGWEQRSYVRGPACPSDYYEDLSYEDLF